MALELLQGDPRTIGDKTLVPIALVASFSRRSSFDLLWARPVAFYEIGPKGHRLFPLLPLPGAERRISMQPGVLLKDIIENLRSSASVNVVFGETRETQGKAIVPVAAVRYAFGAGGGEGACPPTGEQRQPTGGSGGGGGGAVKAKPVAVLEITPEDTRVLPIMDYSRLASMALGGVFFLWFLRTLRRKK